MVNKHFGKQVCFLRYQLECCGFVLFARPIPDIKFDEDFSILLYSDLGEILVLLVAL